MPCKIAELIWADNGNYDVQLFDRALQESRTVLGLWYLFWHHTRRLQWPRTGNEGNARGVLSRTVFL